MTTSVQARDRRVRAVEELAAAVGCATDITGLSDLLKRVLERADDPDVAWEAGGRYDLLLMDGPPTPDLEWTFSYLVNEARSPLLAIQRRTWLNGWPWPEELDPLVTAAEFATDLMCALTARGADAERTIDQLDNALFYAHD
ncbi:hypothetical protein [Nocardiopsis sp. NRRL B-16309]|uniref:hypothetical protein n=1 Tax=Nocardiopsis sp. NRRL B-16309 TaxID=1519494 RepID=UPI0006AE0586|nr:hypothetical protein [Nocardiopsis sp. NRRL B-16309]KOX13698.1 hypothetical protein ADL05_18645 [Nocardiopsis sp. NRRL B-16309]